MRDKYENEIIDKENKERTPEFEDMFDSDVSFALVEKLCEDIRIKDTDNMQMVYEMAMEAISALGELRKADGFPKPKNYPRRQKVLLNRLFRYDLKNDIPFPEVDTPYERFRGQLYRNRRVTLRIVRIERRAEK